jgi:hypothetical protein
VFCRERPGVLTAGGEFTADFQRLPQFVDVRAMVVAEENLGKSWK